MNLRSQKGATGTDIIVAVTIIIISITVVSMIYVNTTLQSRNVTRTAGATRIITNILENIDKMSYDSFVTTYDANSFGKKEDNGTYAGYKSFSQTQIFNTRIPKGYTLYMKADPSFGSYASSAADKFDLVRDIKLVITYSVGTTIESIDFSATKTREIIGEVNVPNTDILSVLGLVNASQGKTFYPIKYSEDAKAYLLTTEDDPEWYNYSAKKWAMVIVSNQPEGSLFDINGKFIGTENYARFVWIPRFFFTGNVGSEKFSEFTYLTTGDAIVSNQQLPSSDGTTSTLFYTTHITKKGESNSYTDTQFTISGGQQLTGKWINAGTSANTGVIEQDQQGKVLNASKYGPCDIH